MKYFLNVCLPQTTDDGDESYEDMDERGVDEEGEFIGSVPQESPLHVVPTFSDGSLDYHQSSRPSGAESPVGVSTTISAWDLWHLMRAVVLFVWFCEVHYKCPK